MARIIRQDGPGKAMLQFALKHLSGKTGRVGWFESSKYPDGTPVAYVASIQEFGSPEKNIPPRSFMRTTITEKRAEWQLVIKAGAAAIMRQSETIDTVMAKIGIRAENDIKKKIKEITSPPLKPATVIARASRKSSKAKSWSIKPLIDTGEMIGTLSSDVVESGANK